MEFKTTGPGTITLPVRQEKPREFRLRNYGTKPIKVNGRPDLLPGETRDFPAQVVNDRAET